MNLSNISTKYIIVIYAILAVAIIALIVYIILDGQSKGADTAITDPTELVFTHTSANTQGELFALTGLTAGEHDCLLNITPTDASGSFSMDVRVFNQFASSGTQVRYDRANDTYILYSTTTNKPVEDPDLYGADFILDQARSPGLFIVESQGASNPPLVRVSNLQNVEEYLFRCPAIQ